MNTSVNLQQQSTASTFSSAKITITNLRLRTYIGFNPEEQIKQQDVIINVKIHYCADTALINDNESAALDYKSITKRIIQHTENGRFQLLEKLTADLLAIAMQSERVLFAEVTVDKPHALRFADSVSVTLNSTRQ